MFQYFYGKFFNNKCTVIKYIYELLFLYFYIFMLNFLYVLLLKDVKFILVHIFIALYKCHILLTMLQITTAHLWCDGHSTSISACGVCEARVTVQVFRRELHIHIHLDYTRVEFYLVSKKKKTMFQIKIYKFKGIQTFKGEYTNKKE